ncbi:TonB family protein [Acaryochloris sp. IP29b_bin.137]|uniref:TonB family protein n=1 Tax=Acaryochloris sp. IP29b_bin.137 TaxID=2969217 RepID=UPI00262BB570|nr:TonB family protein [Acaryochloris sp. IP29b_bin.137]
MFSKSWQRPANLAMMASVAAHGVLFAGLALVPASSQQQAAKKQLRVVSLLQPPPNQPNRLNQPIIDPNTPPPAPGVAGLPLNITTPDSLAELPITNAPNPAFDPFAFSASSVVELPPPPPEASFPPVNPNSLANLPPEQPPTSPQQTPPPSNPAGPFLSDEDFQAWLNGAELPYLNPDPDANPDAKSAGPLKSPEAPSSPVAGKVPSTNLANTGGANDPSKLSDFGPPKKTITRYLAVKYPQAACQERIEGQAEYRVWVSSKAAPLASVLNVSTGSAILDQAVKEAVRKYKIKSEDANTTLVLKSDIKYSQKVCAMKEPAPPTPQAEPNLPPVTPTPTLKPTAPGTTTLPKEPAPAQPSTPSTPAAPEPSLPPVAPVQPAPPTPPQPPIQPDPQAPAAPPAAVPSPSPAQPAASITEPPSNSDFPPEPTIPPPAPMPAAAPQPPAAAPPTPTPPSVPSADAPPAS